MRNLALCGLLLVGACTHNDPELVNRISVDGALTDTRLAVTHFSQGLRESNEYLAVRLCSIRVNLTLSANATRDGHAGLSISGPVAPGVTIGGNASGNSSATDLRANTIELVYRSDNVVVCPPQDTPAAKVDDTTKPASPAKPKATASATTNVATRPRDSLAGTCFELAYREKHPANPGESRYDWLQRICGPGATFLPVK